MFKFCCRDPQQQWLLTMVFISVHVAIHGQSRMALVQLSEFNPDEIVRDGGLETVCHVFTAFLLLKLVLGSWLSCNQ